MSFTLNEPARFPAGTSVSLYQGTPPPDAESLVGPLETQTVGANGTATFTTTLAYSTNYYVGGVVNGKVVTTRLRGDKPPALASPITKAMVDTTGIATLTGSSADDAKAIGAGTGVQISGLPPTDGSVTDVKIASTSRVKVVTNAPLNPMYPEYGAKFDDLTDDSLAIQAALNAMPNGGKLIWPGKAKVATSLSIPSNVHIEGFGPQSSILDYTGSAHALLLGSGALNVDDPWTGGGLRKLRINGTASGIGAVKIRGATRYSIDDVWADGFTTGYGILLNGASFIGRIMGGRIRNCSKGISAKKVTADGSAGEGQAFNAISICGELEIQTCGTGIEIGDPTTTETVPVVGQGAVIEGCTIEGCTVGGIWNVGGNVFNVANNYFEGNGGFAIRIGSAAGNLSLPVVCSITGNYMSLGTEIGVDLQRALHPRIERNYLLGATATGYVVSANVQNARIAYNWENGLATAIADSGVNTIYIPGNGTQTSSTLTIVNSWVASPAAAYSKDPNGYVHLRGTVTAPGSGVNSLISTLPAGNRPTQLCQFSASYWTGTAFAAGQIQVGTDGTIKAFSSADGTPPVSAIYFLDGITFPVF